MAAKSFYGLSKEDAAPIIRGLLIAMLGAALTYLTSYVSGHDFGAYTPVVVALWSVLANAGRKVVDGK